MLNPNPNPQPQTSPQVRLGAYKVRVHWMDTGRMVEKTYMARSKVHAADLAAAEHPTADLFTPFRATTNLTF